MLAGARPFGGRTPLGLLLAAARDRPKPLHEWVADVPAELETVVERCLAKSRDDRYASAAEALEVLARLGPGSDPALPSFRAGRRWSRKAWAYGAVVVALGAASLGARGVIKRPAAVQTATGAATSSAEPIGLLDHPPPETKSSEAAAVYRRALTDLRDGVRRPQTALTRAVQIDPEFAAAHLRLSMAMLPPISRSEYGEALRYRESLDARDREILRAEEPVAAGTPPNLAEAERRYVALHQSRPRDVEILLRLAAIRDRRDPAAAQATFEELLTLAPAMAGAELAIADNAKELDDRDAAIAHYRRCLDLSPMATRCLARLAHVQAPSGQCNAYARDIKRILVLEPDDVYFWRDGLSAALTTDASEDDVRAAMEGAARTQVGAAPMEKAILEGEVALWRGSMVEARDAFERAERLASGTGASQPYPIALPERLAIAQELGDEDAIRTLTRTYVGARALNTDGEFDDVVLAALRRHRVLPDEQVLRLRDGWRSEATDGSAADVWLRYEAGLAVNEQEAREALASDYAQKVGHVALGGNARLGHVYLLAQRFREAISRLELVATNCSLFWGEESYVAPVALAAYDLGQAREGVGDRRGACAMYRRVLARWGAAAPRSTTAEAARARRRVLGCGDGDGE
jgi:serine/threonine-protein kinase